MLNRVGYMVGRCAKPLRLKSKQRRSSRRRMSRTSIDSEVAALVTACVRWKYTETGEDVMNGFRWICAAERRQKRRRGMRLHAPARRLGQPGCRSTSCRRMHPMLWHAGLYCACSAMGEGRLGWRGQVHKREFAFLGQADGWIACRSKAWPVFVPACVAVAVHRGIS
ncbi:hypothetical protein T440DRAFT_122953 [Plenodomus tracheiphilus IPT5]|uniref:Uncharacterized protein n=1 Tax=Plenodomus tracheiphilus IPT5 TaxID=1408161 RepID=A0A6A7B393_9PLEO|nr:hypothetical protein T440DRAFT_122953 [Plenodomus tracheiphilus IPT5]